MKQDTSYDRDGREADAQFACSRLPVWVIPRRQQSPGKRPLTASQRAYSLVSVRAYELAVQWAKRPFRIDLMLPRLSPACPDVMSTALLSLTPSLGEAASVVGLLKTS
jgi:hypothetical protein